MPIARRDLLGLGAAVAISVAASACGGAGAETRRASTSPASAPTPIPTPTPTTPLLAPAFPGQPPPGHLYYGASLPHYRSLPDWEAELGSTLALNRSYFTPDRNETSQLGLQCEDDLAHDRLPHVSTKAPGTWQEVGAGSHDDWLGEIFRTLARQDAPIFLTLHHEPENDAGALGMRPADYVAMQRRAIRLAADTAPQVTVVPILQHWTFDPLRAEGDDPSVWIVKEAAVIGFDIYNPWSPTNDAEWRSFASRADNVVGWFGDTPIAIGEYGCRDDPENPGLVSVWLRDAVDYARSHNIVSMSYFNSDIHAPDGTLELQGEAEQTFAELLTSSWVSRP